MLDLVPAYKVYTDSDMKTDIKNKALTIGQVAGQSGVNRETLRYYERQGLIEEPSRSKSGYRLYLPDAVKRIRFIKRAQELGFSLDEIRGFLVLSTSDQGTCQDIRQQTLNKIHDIEKRLQDLKSIRDRLVRLAEECSSNGPLNECPIIDAFSDGES